ncbi:exonuclease domain-containing protein [Alicyclobacillus fodiniaquatilis]|uniref:Exonuclease domain-containing protein n=1 Tax=Alicyclobacillus fodiniaquatilis TaxID=1661150 RepID=A0ABW4JGN1_9BACL
MRIQDARFVVLDTETTGTNPEIDRVCDISLVEVSRNGIKPLFNTLVHPERDIPPTASAIHHITLRDVADKPKFDAIWPTIVQHLEGAIVVAHNARFDRSMIPETGRPWICSYRLARHLWPDAPAFGNQVLRYWMDINVQAESAHSAAGDTLVTAHVFYRELAYYRKFVAQTDQVEDLISYTYSPIPIDVMPFGKHKGEFMDSIPKSYFSWALQNVSELDKDLRFAMEQRLKQDVRSTETA